MRAFALAALLAGLGLLLATATVRGRLSPAALPRAVGATVVPALALPEWPPPQVPANRRVVTFCDVVISASAKGPAYSYSYSWQRLRSMHFRITLPNGRSVFAPCPPPP